MSYIASEVYEAFSSASDLRRAVGGVRFIRFIAVPAKLSNDRGVAHPAPARCSA